MPSYILRNMPPDLWARFKARSAQEGIPMRALMLKLVEFYADGKLRIGATPNMCKCGHIYAGHGHNQDGTASPCWIYPCQCQDFTEREDAPLTLRSSSEGSIAETEGKMKKKPLNLEAVRARLAEARKRAQDHPQCHCLKPAMFHERYGVWACSDKCARELVAATKTLRRMTGHEEE